MFNYDYEEFDVTYQNFVLITLLVAFQFELARYSNVTKFSGFILSNFVILSIVRGFNFDNYSKIFVAFFN